MRKIVLNVIEVILIFIISLVCIVSILQSTFLREISIFGYHIQAITSNSMHSVLEYGDVILVEKMDFDDIKKGDIVTYLGKEGEVNDKVVTDEVIDIIVENGTKVLKLKDNANIDSSIYKDQFYGKVGFVLCILIPFSILFILELICFAKEARRKELERKMKVHLEVVQNIQNKSDLSKDIEKSINMQIKEIQSAKRNFKKIDELEETIKIPLEEIQRQLRELNKDNVREEKDDGVESDTVILFTKDDIKEVIKKELELTESIDNNSKKDENNVKKREKNGTEMKKKDNSKKE